MVEILDKERPVEEVSRHSLMHPIGTNHFNQSLAPGFLFVFGRRDTVGQRGMESGYTAGPRLRSKSLW